jgi:hypothetical protein
MGYLHAYLCRCTAYVARHRHHLACLSWALSLCAVGPAYGQAAAAWTLAPKAAETAAGVSYSYSPSAGGSAVTTTGRAVTAAANDALMAAETATLSTPAGSTSVTLTRAVSGAAARSALADAALAIGRGGLVGAGIAAGAALAPLLEQWMLDQGYHKNSDGSWGVGSSGAGGSTGTVMTSSSVCIGTICTPTWYYGQTQNESTLAAVAAAYRPYGSGTGYSGFAVYPGPDPLTYHLSWYDSGGNYVDFSIARQVNAGDRACPDGAASVNGQCAGGTPPAPTGPPSLSPSDVHAAAAAAPMPAAVTDWAATLDNAAAVGYPPDVPADPVVSGPSSVVGTSTVTSTSTITKPDGTTQVLTQSQHEESKLTYNGSQVQVQTHTVTTAQNPDGSTTKTEKPVATAPDACAGFPGILGCTQLGTPEAASVPTSSKSVAFTAESISLPSACPASIGVGRFGTLSFQPACDAAGYMRPLILAGSAITALMICVAAVAGVKT